MVEEEEGTANWLDEKTTDAFFSLDELKPETCHAG